MDRGNAHPFRMDRRYSLGRNKVFQQVYRRGVSTPSKHVVLVYQKARVQKVGFSVSAKVGNSVTRNRIRRMLREDFRMERPLLKPGKYIFIARNQAVHATHEALTKDMRSVLSRAGLYAVEEND
ncbi:MAG: ribonuclease P protein component [Christensenellales bacterium]|jgi:ribonuclease P protein component